MTGKTDERLVAAFERIATSLEALHDETKRAGTRFWPEQPIQKEAVLTRVETEEDRARKSLGVDDKPINEWLTDLDVPEDDSGIIGERSRQWLIDHPEEGPKAEVSDAGPKVAEKPSKRSHSKTKSKA
jgi:hypothetical protein